MWVFYIGMNVYVCVPMYMQIGITPWDYTFRVHMGIPSVTIIYIIYRAPYD